MIRIQADFQNTKLPTVVKRDARQARLLPLSHEEGDQQEDEQCRNPADRTVHRGKDDGVTRWFKGTAFQKRTANAKPSPLRPTSQTQFAGAANERARVDKPRDLMTTNGMIYDG